MKSKTTGSTTARPKTGNGRLPAKNENLDSVTASIEKHPSEINILSLNQ
jgi:hypothetical protein